MQTAAIKQCNMLLLVLCTARNVRAQGWNEVKGQFAGKAVALQGRALQQLCHM